MQQTSKHLLQFWTNKINDFLRSRELQIDPLPTVQFVSDNKVKNAKDDILIATGGYQPMQQLIVIYIDNRHIKDILRSYCHEMIHHSQYLDNPDYIRRVFAGSQDSLDDNKELEDVEADAYLRGNLLFRKFTEQLKKESIQ